MIVDYRFKWVEIVLCKTNDNKVIVKFLKENVFFTISYTMSYHKQ